MTSRKQFTASTFLILKAAIKSFGANRNLESAATLAFYGFLSLMPLLLVSLLLLALFLRSSEDASTALAHLLSDLFPAVNVNLLTDVAVVTRGGALGFIGILLLLWSMTPLSGALRTALARMFKMPIQRPFLLAKAVDLAAVFSFLLLFLVLVVIKVLIPVPEGALARVAAFTLRTVLPFGLSVLFLGLFFRIFSPVKLSWRQWLLGAVCVTVLWALLRHVFVWFVQYNPNYGYAFGSLKAMFLLIIWVYYSFAALLLGAEIMANTYRRDALLLRGLFEPTGLRPGGHHTLLEKFERLLADGENVFCEGDPGAEMFVILEGEISLTRSGQKLARLAPGQFFGEMSLLTRTNRSATATAATPVRLAVIDQNNFELLARENPALVRNLTEELARRLAATNRQVQGASSPEI